ncbi:MAG: hypothetical protein Q9201_003326 [Fulgogasparrea decipioides]
MGSTSINPPGYWGYLIKPNKSPSPILEQLLLGIANYILAAFYRLVGGDCDALFLETPQPSLSFVYQSLGCYHTLQPERDPYTAPKLPALTPQGFVRWQTVQILLRPDEHVPFLQNAVKRLDITNPVDGLPFPHPLPREALPSRPDAEMVQWHEGVGEGLLVASHAAAIQGSSADRVGQLDDNITESSITSSVDSHSLIDAARDLGNPPSRHTFCPPPAIRLPQSINAPPRSPQGLPWDLERRRSSASDIRYPISSAGFDDHSTPTTYRNHSGYSRPRPRSPSTASTSSISSSSSSSLTASSASVSPRLSSFRHRYHHSHHPEHQDQPSHQHERPSNGQYPPRAASEPRNRQAHRLPDDRRLPQQPPRPPGSNSRGLNVRWEDMNDAAHHPRRSIEARDQRQISSTVGPRRRSDEDGDRGRRARSGSGGGSGSPLRGVRGRRYTAGGMERG